MIRKVYWSSCKVPLFLSDFNETWIIQTVFFLKNTQISNLIEIRPVGTELLYADRRMDKHEEANSRSSQFCEHT